MNVEELHDLIVSAAETDRRLPPAIRKQKMAAWPDVINDWHGYGWTQLGETVLRPTSEQIDSYDKAIRIVLQATEEDRRLIWAVAHSAAFKARGAAWTKLARMLRLGRDGRVVKRRYLDALVRLHYAMR